MVVRYAYRIVIVMLMLLVSANILSQQVTSCAKLFALSNCNIASSGVWSLYGNQAALSSLKKLNAGLNYYNKYNLDELNSISAIVAMPVSDVVYGLSLYRYGFSVYNENRVSLTGAKLVSPYLSVGVQLDYNFVSANHQNYNSESISSQIGVLWIPSKIFKIGLHVNNPLRNSILSDTKLKNSTITSLGLSYSPNDEVSLYYEIDKNFEILFNNKIGIQYTLLKSLSLRTGFMTLPKSYSVGLGYRLREFSIDVAYQFHPLLIDQKQISISYEF